VGSQDTPLGEPLLDLEGADRLRLELGCTEILAELVDLFGSQTPARVIGIRRAIDDGDVGAVSETAHRLKGGCLTLAATHMARLCTELEMAADRGSLTGATALVDQIEAAFGETHTALLATLT
jgi:HPt (histidine-containing phosphotransfer) domain-containing protein